MVVATNVVVDGKYRIRSQLGAGGQAVAFLAETIGEDTPVVLKILHPEYAERPSSTSAPGSGSSTIAKRFLREGIIQQLLSHSGIARGLGFGEVMIDDANVPYTVLEYVPGRTFDEEIYAKSGALGLLTPYTDENGRTQMRLSSPEEKPERLKGPAYEDWATVLRFMRDLIEALAYLHTLSGRRGGEQLHAIYHRDVKPENIVIQRNPYGHIIRCVLLDLGIARITKGLAELVGVDRTLTRAGTVIGTPYYMAPEQATDGASAGPQADVYAAGLMFFLALTGRLPFRHAPDFMAYVSELALAKQPHDPRRYVEGVPRDFAELIMKAMAKDPRDRYPDALAMLTAFNVAESNLITRSLGIQHEPEGMRTAEYASGRPPSTATTLRPPPPPRREEYAARSNTAWKLVVSGVIVTAFASGAIFGLRYLDQRTMPVRAAAPSAYAPQMPAAASMPVETAAAHRNLVQDRRTVELMCERANSMARVDPARASTIRNEVSRDYPALFAEVPACRAPGSR